MTSPEVSGAWYRLDQEALLQADIPDTGQPIGLSMSVRMPSSAGQMHVRKCPVCPDFCIALISHAYFADIFRTSRCPGGAEVMIGWSFFGGFGHLCLSGFLSVPHGPAKSMPAIPSAPIKYGSPHPS